MILHTFAVFPNLFVSCFGAVGFAGAGNGGDVWLPLAISQPRGVFAAVPQPSPSRAFSPSSSPAAGVALGAITSLGHWSGLET